MTGSLHFLTKRKCIHFVTIVYSVLETSLGPPGLLNLPNYTYEIFAWSLAEAGLKLLQEIIFLLDAAEPLGKAKSHELSSSVALRSICC